jgi:methionine synthase II (cobalamin-independent)
VFATLLGALPRPTGDGSAVDRMLEAAVRAQEEAGLEPITDGRLRGAAFRELPTARDAVAAWRATQGLTDRAVKQALPGPFSLEAPVESLIEVVAGLAAAGCPMVEIEETAMDRLADEADRARFRDAHERVLEHASEIHLSLSIVGDAPPQEAWQTVLDLPYQSLAVDLIAGPDSWNLVTRLAGDRGVIAGVESSGQRDEGKEVLLWAAHYAASTKGRGMQRVGLGSAGSWANLTWEAAVRKMRLLGEAARLATLPPGSELAHSVDARSISPRRAALGHDA